MSDFLKNLINRHNSPNARAKTSVVEPRPKSRFENNSDSAVEANGTKNDNIRSSAVSNGLSETRNDAQQDHREDAPIQLDIEQPTLVAESREVGPADRKASPPSLNGVDDLAGRIEALSLQLGSKLSFTQPKTDEQINNKYIESESPDGTTNRSTQVDRDESSKSYQLNQQIDAVIKRLANKNNDPRPEQVTNKPQTSSFATEKTPDLKQQRQGRQVVPIESESSSKLGILNNENQPEQHTVHQQGLLQQPGWLTEMQSDLNKRWQHINTKTESTKSVVNVTIGRVEVRAVQNSGGQAPRVKKKSSGVMSLDDYLKSRGKEGRA